MYRQNFYLYSYKSTHTASSCLMTNCISLITDTKESYT